MFGTTDIPFGEFDAPPSLNAHGTLAHSLYRDPAGRVAYVERLRELLATVWMEQGLLPQLRPTGRHRGGARAARSARRNGKDAERVRNFIRARREQILAAIEPGVSRLALAADFPAPPSVTEAAAAAVGVAIRRRPGLGGGLERRAGRTPAPASPASPTPPATSRPCSLAPRGAPNREGPGPDSSSPPAQSSTGIAA